MIDHESFLLKAFIKTMQRQLKQMEYADSFNKLQVLKAYFPSYLQANVIINAITNESIGQDFPSAPDL